MTSRFNILRVGRWRLPAIVERAISIAVLEDDDQETRRTKRLMTGAVWFALTNPWPLIFLLIAADAPIAVWVVFGSFLSAVVVLVVLWLRPASFPGIFHFLLLANFAVSVALTLLFGGFLASGINFIWAIVLVLGGLVVFGDWRAGAWLATGIVAFIASSIGTRFVEPLYEFPSPEISAGFTFLIVLVFVSFVLWYYIHQRAELLELSDRLLDNILPKAIADRLKVSDEMIAEEYDSASILFADVAGFTPMSADMTPNQLVSLLNEIFSEFDRMVEARGLEKIKTIGDAYMVAAGVPEARPDHAQAICDLALEMQEVVHDRTFGGRQISFRIGINSGVVVAGIIGMNKFSYDLWGDSVNVASRMESSGREGRIQITETTRDLVHEDFDCEPGGPIEVKGKGLMNVWFLESRNSG
ncbi:MAG: adenylate/guanylate cyclase domain-containing protein [Acidimicrobiia bacterium]